MKENLATALEALFGKSKVVKEKNTTEIEKPAAKLVEEAQNYYDLVGGFYETRRLDRHWR